MPNRPRHERGGPGGRVFSPDPKVNADEALREAGAAVRELEQLLPILETDPDSALALAGQIRGRLHDSVDYLRNLEALVAHAKQR